MQRDFVPVQATVDGRKTIWQVDVTNLGLEGLLLLQKELAGTLIHSDVVIDGIVYSTIGVSKMSYGVSGNTRRKELKRNSKVRKIKNKFKEERKNDKY